MNARDNSKSKYLAKCILAGLLTAVLATAPGSGAMADDVESTTIATATLGDARELDGFTNVTVGGVEETSIRTYDERSCLTTQPDVAQNYMRFFLANDRIPANDTSVYVTVEYYDTGTGSFSIQYKKGATFPTGARVVNLQDTNAWTSVEIELSGAYFDGSTNEGAFRINSWDSRFGQSATGVCVGRLQVSTVPQLQLVDESLVFDAGEAVIAVAAQAEQVAYEIKREGVVVDSGDVDLQAGRGSIDVTALLPGYYTVDISAEGLHRSASFAILAPRSVGPDARVGTAVHFAQGQPTDLMSLVNAAGIGWTRDEILWKDVEKQPGVYTFPAYADEHLALAESSDTDVLFIAAFRNPLYDSGKTPSSPEAQAAYAQYIVEVLDHYQHITAVQVWNEFNHATFNDGDCGMTADCYLPLLQTAYTAIKASHPDVKVIAPSLAGVPHSWLQRLVDLGGLDYLDALSFHPYRYPGAPESLASALQQVREYVRDHNDGEDVPIWLTEIGWPTHEGGGTTEAQQAQYLVRAQTLAFANGVEQVSWYNLYSKGDDAANTEHNFGVVRRPYNGVTGFSPKPAYVAQAVLTQKLSGKSLVGRDELSDSIHSYVFGSGIETTRVIWSTTNASVELSTTEPLQITEIDGQTQLLTPLNGTVSLPTGGRPLFVEGEVSAVSAGGSGQSVIDVPEQVAVGDSIAVGVRVGGVTGVETVLIHVDGDPHIVQVQDGVAQLSVSLPSLASPGVRTVRVVVERDGVALAQLRADVNVTPQVDLVVEPAMESDSGSAGLRLTLVNRSVSAPLSVDQLDWTLGDDSGTVSLAEPVPPKDEFVTTVPIEGIEWWTRYAYSVTAKSLGVTVHSAAAATGWGPIASVADTTSDAIDLVAMGDWVRLTSDWGGASDLSGEVSFRYSEDGLHVLADVEDDIHVPGTVASDIYLADSVQLAVSNTLPDRSTAYVELGFADTVSDPVVYTWREPVGQAPGLTPGATVDVERTDSGRTRYEAFLPWKSIGFDQAPESAFGLSLLVNDSDGSGRKGWIEWGSGIGMTKQPSLYQTVFLLAEPTPTEWATADTYSAGDIVTYEDRLYRALWWTKSDIPGTSVYGPWAETGESRQCASGQVGAWTASGVFLEGDIVHFEDAVWEAQWWTRNQQPGDAYGPWVSRGNCA